jgi:hypothetical protein
MGHKYYRVVPIRNLLIDKSWVWLSNPPEELVSGWPGLMSNPRFDTLIVSRLTELYCCNVVEQ